MKNHVTLSIIVLSFFICPKMKSQNCCGKYSFLHLIKLQEANQEDMEKHLSDYCFEFSSSEIFEGDSCFTYNRCLLGNPEGFSFHRDLFTWFKNEDHCLFATYDNNIYLNLVEKLEKYAIDVSEENIRIYSYLYHLFLCSETETVNGIMVYSVRVFRK